MRKRKHRYLKGVLAGMIGGFVGSWTMNQFSSGVGQLEKKWQASEGNGQPGKSDSNADEAATTLLAQRISQAVRGRKLTDNEKKTAEPIVHYGFGTLVGGLYGFLNEVTPLTRKGAGAAYGTAVWLGGDEIAVPALELSKPSLSYPLGVHAQALASHLVYGFTSEGVRRGIRALL